MNKKGQSLVLFIIMIPIIFIIFIYVYDYGNYLQNKTKINDITVETAKEVLLSNNPNKEEETTKLFKLNNIDTANLKVTYQDNILKITNKIKIKEKSKFSKINLNEITINIVAEKVNNDIIIKE
jgi:Flp pilus assembly protein TadG